jgi:hypothetical protein
MEQLKIIWHDDGKHRSNSSSVSIRSFTHLGVFDVISPTDITGVGGCYGDALEDFIEQFDSYLDGLMEFRDEVLNTKKSYDNEYVVSVDCSGNPLR